MDERLPLGAYLSGAYVEGGGEKGKRGEEEMG
jgi:hypothetical protein